MRGFGELESVAMNRVWSCEDTTTVPEVFDTLKTTRDIAYTTVLSTKDKLHRKCKGSLAHRQHGKALLYWCTSTQEACSARLIRDALGTGGARGLVFTRFLEQMTDDESSRLRRVLRRSADQEAE